MYVNFVFKRSSLALAVVRGDCLYFRDFNVPFHTVQTHVAWAESPLLLAQHGTAALEARPVRKLPDLCAARCAIAYYSWMGNIIRAFSIYSFALLSSIVMPKYLLLLMPLQSNEPDSDKAFIANFTTFLLYGPCLLLLFCTLYSSYSVVTSPQPIHEKISLAVIHILVFVPMGLSSAWLFLPPSSSPNTEGHSDELLMVCSVWSAAGVPATFAVLFSMTFYQEINHKGTTQFVHVLRIYQALNIFLRDGHLDPDKLSPDWIAKKTRNFTPQDAEDFQLRGLFDLVQDFQNDPQNGSETWPDVLYTWLQSTYTSHPPEIRPSNQSVELQQMGDDSTAPSS